MPIVLPLKAHYARSAEHEKRRRDFYTMIARELEFEGWDRVQKIPKPEGEAGRDGRRQEIERPTAKRAAKFDRRSSAAEYLSFGSMLDDRTSVTMTDFEKGRARVRGDIRRNIAKAIVEDRELVTSALKSVDWMASGGGGYKGGGYSFDIGDASSALDRLAGIVPPHLLLLLNDVLLCDKFLWEVPKTADRKADAERREVWLESIREALDYAAFAYGHYARKESDGWLEVMMPRWTSARDIQMRRAVDTARREPDPSGRTWEQRRAEEKARRSNYEAIARSSAQ